MTLPLVVLLLLALSSGADAEARDRVTVEVRGDRLTLRAEKAPLAAVLEQLAKATGLVVHGAEPLDEPVSLELHDVLLEDALRQLLRSRSTLVVYQGKRARVPSAIYVFRGGAGSVPPWLAKDPAAPSTSESELLEAQARVDAELVAKAPYSVARVDELDEDLRRIVEEDPRRRSRWLESLLADPHPGARLIALQGLEQARSLDLGSLAAAFKDPDLAVQQAALQILISRRVSDRAVETIRAAAEAQDEAALRQLMMDAIGP